ncbi:MAG: glycine-rich protein, partial [Bacteroidota bacterium]
MSKYLKLLISYLLFVVCFDSQPSFGQNRQNDKWHFGINGSVDFSTGVPVSTTGSAIFTGEGSASIADRYSGDLLFYTNGITIWDRMNQPMPNGTGLLGGTPALTSSTTAALIVPNPGNTALYYVFTVDEFGGPNGLRMNVVDMTLNGGMGDVVVGQKNILVSNNGISEKLECAPMANGAGYWLISRQVSGNQYFAWQVTATGISSTPVTSFAGTSTINGAGFLKFNRDHTRLANAYVVGTVDVLSFNNSTGQITNIVSLPVPIGSSVYGVEFSPSGRYLYVSNLLDGIFQFDLNASNVAASRQTVANAYGAALQLGPDCIIYIANGGLGSIPNPDLPVPACGFNASALNIQPGGSSYGLPMDVIYLDDPIGQINVISPITPCNGTQVQFTFSGLNLYPQFIQWNFGDPASGINNSATGALFDPVTHTFNSPGQYTIQVVYENQCRMDTLIDTITVVNCNPPSGTCLDFQYTGSPQQWTVPAGVDTLFIKMWGAAGGGGPEPVNNAGGGGGYTEVTLPVVPGDVLQIVVGGGGFAAQGHIGGLGGYGGGGNGGSGNRVELVFGVPTDVGGAGGGGGLTLVRLIGSINNIIGIAGGGGGGTSGRIGGGGGGLDAEYTPANNQFNIHGFGGTQTAGGAPSSNTLCPNPVLGTAGAGQQGGTGATDFGGTLADRTGGGGGGSGYFGGGGGGSHDGCFGVGSAGGGGSGFICATCPGVIGNTVTANLFAFGQPANSSDPILSLFPGVGLGLDNSNGGNGLVYICYGNCNPTTASIIASSCDSYTSPSGNIITQSGTFIDTIPNSFGCDSIITITLTINNSYVPQPLNITACDSYTAPWGVVYNQSGFYADTLVSFNGCDSIISINLTIASSVVTPVQNVSACDSYAAPWGTTYTQSGLYVVTLQTSAGCDSVVSILLVIGNTVVAPTQIASACISYNSPWGTVYTQSGLYTDTLSTVNGCDSIVSVNLTITGLPVLNAVVTADTCDLGVGSAAVLASGGTGGYSYVWSNGSTNNALSNLGGGTYTVTVTDQGGCTSSTQVLVTSI